MSAQAIGFRPVTSLGDVWKEAHAACKDQAVFNLLLAYEFPIALIDSNFVSTYEGEAREWHSESPPPELPFSHGQFFKGEKGIQHLLGELKAKKASRRAILSLINMDDVIGQGDEPIPSFMVCQCGIEGDVLYVTMYFRALEVKKFLLINLAEASLLIRRIREEFGQLSKVRFVLVAFRAYEDPNFVLRHAKVDTETRGKIAAAVAKQDVKKLLEWLEDKKRRRSPISVEGLLEMATAVDEFGGKYSRKFRADIRKAVESLELLKKLRQRASESDEEEREYAKFVGLLDSCIRELGTGVRKGGQVGSEEDS